ncbi:MAG: ABC transporter permease [Clostridia bacterium]|nr:ABC transporter permease [Clostridia bacterium]
MNLLAFFINRAVMQGTPLLFGATGEIVTEKSGNLNLGIPGIMYIGAISGVIGTFFYENSPIFVPALGVVIALISCLIGSLIASLIYCFLTITLRANQNVTGLALTTFGVGFGNFFGGSLIKITKSSVPYIALTETGEAFSWHMPIADSMGWFGTLFLSYGFMVYLSIVLAILASWFLNRTRKGLYLRAIGENPATADAAGIDVPRYKYVATCVGGMIAGLGGLFFIMDYSGGIWSNNGFGDRGWLAIAIVIFAIWRPGLAIPASYLFGALYILFHYLSLPMQMIPILQMLPYVVTILAIVFTSVRKKRENQPPASLGLSYFREER